MRNYLSFGGGVNSVAMYLLLKDQGVDFEAVFVDHGTDWPETYSYVDIFKKMYPLTVLKPRLKENGKTYNNLYKYCWDEKIFPFRHFRWCTEKFKVKPIYNYIKTPCFMFLGFASDEAHRAKISHNKGVENRFPLIESEINRQECKNLIKKHRLPIPQKSGCYICPFQRTAQFKNLRRKHPELFCKAEQLEKRKIDERKRIGKKPIYILNASLRSVVDENQIQVFKQDEYPHCECML